MPEATEQLSLRPSFSVINDFETFLVVQLQWMFIVKATFTVTHAHNDYNYKPQSPHRYGVCPFHKLQVAVQND